MRSDYSRLAIKEDEGKTVRERGQTVRKEARTPVVGLVWLPGCWPVQNCYVRETGHTHACARISLHHTYFLSSRTECLCLGSALSGVVCVCACVCMCACVWRECACVCVRACVFIQVAVNGLFKVWIYPSCETLQSSSEGSRYPQQEEKGEVWRGRECRVSRIDSGGSGREVGGREINPGQLRPKGPFGRGYVEKNNVSTHQTSIP